MIKAIKSTIYLAVEKLPRLAFLKLINLMYAIKGVKNTKAYYDSNIYTLVSSDSRLSLQCKQRFRIFLSGIDVRISRLSEEYQLTSENLKIPPSDEQYSSNLFVDVGANIGEFALWASKNNICRYVGFEPDEFAYKLANQNLAQILRKNSSYNYEVHQLALSNENSTRPFFLSTNNADSSLVPPPSYTKKTTINCQKADDFFLQEYPNLKFPYITKIEAEGAELSVILGAKKLISNSLYIAIDGGPENQGKITLPDCLNLIMSFRSHEILDFNLDRGTCLLVRQIQKVSL